MSTQTTPTTAATAAAFPAWTFTIPASVSQFQLAIYGQDPVSLNWYYWNPATSAYVQFSGDGPAVAPLIAVPAGTTSYTVNLPATQYLQSGVVAMFLGSSVGIPVTTGVPGSPTVGTNPDDVFSLFEFTYVQDAAGNATLDVDISNVDQVGFTYTVQSSGAPFPLAEVGSTVARGTVFSRFATAFPAGTPYNSCLLYGIGQVGGSAQQLRLVAPQDVLQAVAAPTALSFIQPTGAATATPFNANSYFYQTTEATATGETVPGPAAFGGFLLGRNGQPQASEVNVGWQSGGTPTAYTPTNPSAQTINLYRVAIGALDAGSAVPPPPATGYQRVASLSIAAWNAQTGPYYVDSSATVGTQTPPASSYGFEGLSTWFDGPLQDFFNRYAKNTFALFQSNQNGGTNGTLWTGTVLEVAPDSGTAITTQQYIDENGNAQSIAATWQWGDGTQTYKVLQLVGNAYDASNLSTIPAAGASGLTQGEYQGAVLNIYVPYFTGNTGLSSIPWPDGTTYTLPSAPAWLQNAGNGPSQMVFGCAGVFATPNDPDAVAQSSFAVLALNALTNLQNVIVSALNRGLATGYGFAVPPQGYSCLLNFSQAPSATPSTTGLAAGTYTYYLSGTLNDGSESALSWAQTIVLTQASSVALTWNPQAAALYKQVNVYRQAGTGPIQLIAALSNTTPPPVSTYTDTNAALPTQPTTGAPFVFYPDWNDASGANYVASNLYSAFVHQNLTVDPTNGISINGLTYGYPFDDQGGFSTNINYGTALPTGAITFTLTP